MGHIAPRAPPMPCLPLPAAVAVVREVSVLSGVK